MNPCAVHTTCRVQVMSFAQSNRLLVDYPPLFAVCAILQREMAYFVLVLIQHVLGQGYTSFVILDIVFPVRAVS